MKKILLALTLILTLATQSQAVCSRLMGNIIICLNADTKPTTSITNGTLLVTLDAPYTQYTFSTSDNQWHQQGTDWTSLTSKPSFGTAATANLGTGASDAAYGNHAHSGTYEPANANIQSHVSQTHVVANNAIIGATKTKITYDAKGLITSGDDATTADIADSTNKRYVSDTQLSNIHASGSDAETTTTIGTLISGATDKATPVDADTIGLSDSAASNVMKKLTWANTKATLKSYFDGLYPTAAGKAGSQTLVGGTAASETLTLQSTSHGTKGKLLFGTSTYDEVNNRLGLGTQSPSSGKISFGQSATELISLWDDAAAANRYGIGIASGEMQFYTPTSGHVSIRTGGYAGSEQFTVTSTGTTIKGDLTIKSTITGLTKATAGVVSAYGGTSCTNQFPRSLDASGAATCASVDLSSDTAATALPITKAGTGVTSRSANGVVVGTGVNTTAEKIIPSCSNAATSKLLYDNATQTFSCGTDSIGSGSLPSSAGLNNQYLKEDGAGNSAWDTFAYSKIVGAGPPGTSPISDGNKVTAWATFFSAATDPSSITAGQLSTNHCSSTQCHGVRTYNGWDGNFRPWLTTAEQPIWWGTIPAQQSQVMGHYRIKGSFTGYSTFNQGGVFRARWGSVGNTQLTSPVWVSFNIGAMGNNVVDVPITFECNTSFTGSAPQSPYMVCVISKSSTVTYYVAKAPYTIDPAQGFRIEPTWQWTSNWARLISNGISIERLP